MEQNNDTREIDLSRLITVLLRFGWIIVLAAVLVGSASYFASKKFIEKKYTATSTMYVWSVERKDSTNQAISSGELNASQSLANTYSYILSSAQVIDKVAEELGLSAAEGYSPESIRGMLSISTVNNTEVIRVTVTCADREKAAAIANAIVLYGGPIIQNITKAGATEVIDSAKVPTSPSSPNSFRNGMLGAVIAAVLVAGIIILVDLTDRRIKNLEDLATFDGANSLPLVAVIPRLDSGRRSRKYGYDNYGGYKGYNSYDNEKKA